MAKSKLKFPYSKEVVDALAAFITILETAAPERISTGELNYACEDGRIGGLLGIRINIEMGDAEHDELEERIGRSRADRGVEAKVALRSDAA